MQILPQSLQTQSLLEVKKTIDCSDLCQKSDILF